MIMVMIFHFFRIINESTEKQSFIRNPNSYRVNYYLCVYNKKNYENCYKYQYLRYGRVGMK